jgi:hypothetical protein
MDFTQFGTAVHKRFVQMSAGELYVAGTEEDDIFAHYLASFPEGSNPIYKKRTEHDCSCCKNFIRNVGRVVAIQDGEIHTIWDVKGLDEPAYREVAKAMDKYVRGLALTSIYRTKEPSYGTEVTRQLVDGKVVARWNHFHGQIDKKHKSSKPDEEKGIFNTAAQVFKRGLEELSITALAEVLSLCEEKTVYRGEEHLPAVKAFMKAKKEFDKLKTAKAKNIFVFTHANEPIARFRNTVIGTLVEDLTNGVEFEHAVKSFETKVAPTNYKRTTALITPRMVEDAMKTVRELELEPSLNRRLANLSDVSVNNVLWVDRSVKGRMKGGVEGLLMEAAARGASKPSEDKAQDISIGDFITKVLPKAVEIELHLKNQHTSNFMTVTAPVYADAKNLFKWDNGFAWSYDGNITDSIREKVKAAGGNVNARLRFSLAWFNYDDLDFHVETPDRHHVYFGNKAGILDVDMNAGSGQSRQPVENLSFTHPRDGRYRVWVNQYQRRETEDKGFSIEIAHEGGVGQLSCKKGMTTGKSIVVGEFKVKDGRIVEAEYGVDMVGEGIPMDKWGLKTESMVKVQTIMLSPNYWDDNAVGNKHYFFLLAGCKVDGPARGIYNEFLSSKLEKHRKVFEVLGDKTKCPPVDDQLSGLGFSSTRGDKIVAVAKSERSTRSFNINF